MFSWAQMTNTFFSFRLHVFWAHREITAALTLAPAAGSCHLCRPPPDPTTDPTNHPTAAGAKWYQGFLHFAVVLLFLQDLSHLKNFYLFIFNMYCLCFFRPILRRGWGHDPVCWMPAMMLIPKGLSFHTVTEDCTRGQPAPPWRHPPISTVL